MYDYRDVLKAEIAFWQELLKDSGFSNDSPEYQRMLHAIELAKLKFSDHVKPQHLH